MRAALRRSLSSCLVALIAAGCAPNSAEDSAPCDGKCDGPLGDAPLATAIGPLDIVDTEYRFAAATDADVLEDRDTEIWAHVWRPTARGASPRPVLVFLHGNHATCGSWAADGSVRYDTGCQYTSSGTCPDGMEVVPNHMGYDYLAEHLARWGYVVVSINANRGITCARGIYGDGGLNLARGRLVLKHLEILAKWNNADDTDDLFPIPEALKDLQGSLDFDNVGLMGHSRGGEGVRAAYVQYRDQGSEWPSKILEPVTFNGIFEIGPVDGQTGRTLDAPGAPWAVMLPMCDGDVSNLQGMKPFDRMLNGDPETNATPKAMFAAWGTNHNFFNKQWMESDANGCSGEGHEALFTRQASDAMSDQVKVGLSSMAAFFRAHVGPQSHRAFNRTFDPLYALSPALLDLTNYDRAYVDSTSAEGRKLLQAFTLKADEPVLVNADDPEGASYLPYTATNVELKLSTVPEHDAVQRAAQLSWSPVDGEDAPSFETVWTAPGAGEDISEMAYLGLRVSRQKDERNPVTATDFSVQLVAADGSVSSAVAVGGYASLVGPVGGEWGNHYVLQSVRLPLDQFANIDLSAVRGLRLVFDRTESGAIYLADVSVGKDLTPTGTVPTPNGGNTNVGNGTDVPPGNNVVHDPNNANNTVVDVTPDPNGSDTQLRFYSDARFWIGDTLPSLVIGDKRFNLSTPASDGTDRMITFHVPTVDFKAIVAATPEANVVVEYGPAGQPQESWEFGPISQWNL